MCPTIVTGRKESVCQHFQATAQSNQLPMPEQPKLYLRTVQDNKADRATMERIHNSCIEWLNTEKHTPEQWGAKPLTKEQAEKEADKFIRLGIQIVEIDFPARADAESLGATERIPVAMYGTGKRTPLLPRDPNLPEGVEEDFDSKLYLIVLTVGRKYRGMKIGKRLIQMAYNEAKELGKGILLCRS